jgi:hypothetical protein
MKSRKNELEVDFNGGQKPLTASEQKALSAYFAGRNVSKKLKKSKAASRSSKRTKKVQA